MNKKLKIALRRRSSEQGFAITIALGLGLVMVLIAATMIMRSQGDEVTAMAQKATNDSLGVSETGITRVQSLLKKFPKMAQKPKSDWSSEYTRLSSINTCLGSNTLTSNIITNINTWIKLDNSLSNPDLKKGEIKILDYTYTGNVGTLKVAGRATSENGGTNSSVGNATTYLQVSVPIVPLADFPIPGLWTKNFIAMGSNSVNGNVLVAGCSIPSGVLPTNIVTGTGNLTANPSVEFPPIPELPASDVKTIGAITSSVTLPKTGAGADTAGSDGVFRYLVGKSGQYSIDLNETKALTITSGKKVTLYLQGDIRLSENSKIIHTSMPTTNFQIYGSDGGTHYRNPSDTSTYKTANISLNGNSSTNTFIYAPEATVSINGGGSQPSTPIVKGSVWVKAWNGSNVNQVVVTQSANWADIPVEQPKTISSIQIWERRQASK